jgi:hypothetical protein
VSASEESEQQVYIRAIRAGERRGYELCSWSDTAGNIGLGKWLLNANSDSILMFI